MHIEKNVCENFVGTLLDSEAKMKRYHECSNGSTRFENEKEFTPNRSR